VTLVLLAVLQGVVGTAVALAVYGAGFSLAVAAAVPWLDEAYEEDERGLAYGMQNLVYAGGYTVGPLLGGVLLEVADADLAYGLTAVALGAAVVALVLTTRPAQPARRA
jgi:MFS family permease